MVDFGNRLKTLRIQKGFTQKELASQVGVTKSTISAYEKDDRRPPYDTLVLLARIFNVSTDYLLGLHQKTGSYLDLSGLTDEEKTAVTSLVKSMRK